MPKNNNIYDESSIKSLDWKDHIRSRPGMYIGKLGNGASYDDGIYVLIKEVIDNSIDEHIMGHGKKIDITINDNEITIRDYGRGIPLGKVSDCVSKINTGGKYDSKAFQKSVGLNGVGLKAVNALSQTFTVQSIRDNDTVIYSYQMGDLSSNTDISKSDLKNGTIITFVPDYNIFNKYKFLNEHIENQLWYYAYLNPNLTIYFNKNKIYSKDGLKDLLLKDNQHSSFIYPIIHLRDNDIEIAMSHGKQYSENYTTFVNGQNTTQGGTHLASFREALVRTLRDFYKKDFDASDIRTSIIASISIRVQNPVFESQTKTKLGSPDMGPDGPTVRIFVNEFIKKHLDNFLHKNKEVSELLLSKILQSEKERKEMLGIRKIASKRSKIANLHNKKLRDCKFHYNNDNADSNNIETMIFITEGDSASGSITKTRNVQNQAVFSLRGKPLNSYGLTKKVVYENEEFNLLQHALNIENGIEGLRYNKIIIATDADVDGMHIRLLILTFFLQFFSELVQRGHVYILETPLFRVRNKKETIYAYNEAEKNNAINTLAGKPEITRFKGLGEISPHEFKNFIGENIRLEKVIYRDNNSIDKTLSYYMGKNTPTRQEFIINNLVVEEDV